MKKARMNISHFRFILFKLKIFGEIVTTNKKTLNKCSHFAFLFSLLYGCYSMLLPYVM